MFVFGKLVCVILQRALYLDRTLARNIVLISSNVQARAVLVKIMLNLLQEKDRHEVGETEK